MDELSDEQILDKVVGAVLGIVEKLIDNGRRRKALEHAWWLHERENFDSNDTDHAATVTSSAGTFYAFLKGDA